MDIIRDFKFMISFFILCIIINKILGILAVIISKEGTDIRQVYKLFCSSDLKLIKNEELLEYICSTLEDLGYKNTVIAENLEEVLCYKDNSPTVVYLLKPVDDLVDLDIFYSIIGKMKSKKLKKGILITKGGYIPQCYKEIKDIRNSGIDIRIIDGKELVKLIRKNIEKDMISEGAV
jgi:hypothetical protein